MDYILLKYQKVYPFNYSNVSCVQMAKFFCLAISTVVNIMQSVILDIHCWRCPSEATT